MGASGSARVWLLSFVSPSPSRFVTRREPDCFPLTLTVYANCVQPPPRQEGPRIEGGLRVPGSEEVARLHAHAGVRAPQSWLGDTQRATGDSKGATHEQLQAVREASRAMGTELWRIPSSGGTLDSASPTLDGTTRHRL